MRGAVAAALFSVLLTTVTLVACESGPSAPAAASSRSVGPAGGTVEVVGARLTLPAGALAQPTEITIDAAEGSGPPTYDALSPVFQFGPAGLHFAVPITIELTYAGDGTGATVLWTTEDGAGYEELATTLGRAGLASAQVAHFSRGLVGRRRPAPPVSSADGGPSPGADGGDVDAGSADAGSPDASSVTPDAGGNDGGTEAGGGPGPGCFPKVGSCNQCCTTTQCCGPGQCCAFST